MINKKGTIQGILISIIIFVGVISLIGLFAVSVGNDNSVTMEGNYYQNISSKMDNMYSLSENLKNSTQGSGGGAIDAASNFIGGTLSAIKLTFSSLDLTNAIITKSTEVMKTPPIIAKIAITILILIITFAIIGAIVKKDV
jgi:hypothetical protein